MSTQPIQPEPDHDWLDVADAVGVTSVPKPLHPSVRGLLSDDSLDAVVSKWARDYAEPACSRCRETGVVDQFVWVLGTTIQITCPDCGGDGGDVR